MQIKKHPKNIIIYDIKKAVSSNDGWYEVAPISAWEKKFEYEIKQAMTNARMSATQVNTFYKPIIHQLISYVQALPASEYNHHAYAGGIIEHTLEVMRISSIYRRNFLYSDTGNETDVENQADVFAYAVFCASALHDIGKLITDFDVVYRLNSTDKPKPWCPANGPLTVGSFYKFRFSPMRDQKAHVSASSILLTALIPNDGLRWINEHKALSIKLIHTVAGRFRLGGEIATVLQYSDAESAHNNLIKGTNVDNKNAAGIKYSGGSKSPADIIMDMMRQAIESNDIRINVPGAMMWVIGEYVYLVSKPIVDKCRELANKTGYTILPTNEVAMFSMLCNAGYAERHLVTQDQVHTMTIIMPTNATDNWEATLTFLVIKRNVLDPNGTLNLVQANASIIDRTEEKGYKARRNKQPTENPVYTEKNTTLNTAPEKNTTDINESFVLSNDPSRHSLSKFISDEKIIVPTIKTRKTRKTTMPDFSKQHSEAMPDFSQNNAKKNSPSLNSLTDQMNQKEIVVPTRTRKKYPSVDNANNANNSNNPFNPLDRSTGSLHNEMINQTLNNAINAACKEVRAKDFLDWLSDVLINRKLSFNEETSMIINIEEGVFVTSPNIFHEYSKALAQGASSSIIITGLKKENALVIRNNFPIIIMEVLKTNKRIRLSGLLIKRESLFECSNLPKISDSKVRLIN